MPSLVGLGSNQGRPNTSVRGIDVLAEFSGGTTLMALLFTSVSHFLPEVPPSPAPSLFFGRLEVSCLRRPFRPFLAGRLYLQES